MQLQVTNNKGGDVDDWWYGKIGADGRVGIFPGTYVVPVGAPDNPHPAQDEQEGEREQKLAALRARRSERRVAVNRLAGENEALRDRLDRLEAEVRAIGSSPLASSPVHHFAAMF